MVVLVVGGCGSTAGTPVAVGSPPRTAAPADDCQAPPGVRAPVPRASATVGGVAQKLTLGTDDPIGAFALSRDGSRLVAGDWGSGLTVWDLARGEAVCALSGHTDQINGVALSPDGARVASASDDGTVRLWNTTGGAPVVLWAGDEKIQDVAFSQDGARLAAVGYDEAIRLWNVGEKDVPGPVVQTDGNRYGVAWSPDGRTAAAAGDGTVVLVDADGTPGATLRTDDARALDDVAFSPDGTLVAAASENEKAYLWRVADGSLVRVFDGPVNYLQAVAFSPDGSLLAATGNQGSTFVWDVATGARRQKLQNRGASYDVAFFPDGQSLVASSSEEIWTWQVS